MTAPAAAQLLMTEILAPLGANRSANELYHAERAGSPRVEVTRGQPTPRVPISVLTFVRVVVALLKLWRRAAAPSKRAASDRDILFSGI